MDVVFEKYGKDIFRDDHAENSGSSFNTGDGLGGWR